MKKNTPPQQLPKPGKSAPSQKKASKTVTPRRAAKPAKPAKKIKETLEEKTKRIALNLIKQLPPELEKPASEVLILVKKRPAGDMDEFLLGVFEGPTREELGEGGFGIPPRITLFSQNLWEESENDPQAFEEEVRVTLYHELGHFLGLEEGDLEERDLG